MRKKLQASILIIFLIQQLLAAQPETYSVAIAPFSSKKYSAFSPVYYKKGIVFCTNRSPNSILSFSGSQNISQFKIYCTNTLDKGKSRSAKLFSRELKTNVNDGPVTFNLTGDTIYYSRNLSLTNKKTNHAGPENKLGIFRAVLVNGKWTKVREFRYNDETYNVTAPCLSPDGKKLFFASDKPGGIGGYDLYYSQWKGDYWDKPINLGAAINTTGNESYPFINPSGDLFFSSDGHPGLGGMDIFYSQFSNMEWLAPVQLDPPINSRYNDFGIITDSLMNEGYFSTDRNKTTEIFHFKTAIPQVFYHTIQKENQYCFMFRDTGSIVVDTSNLRYKWNFGDGKSSDRMVTSHCFDGPGDYNVKLDLIEKNTGKLFFSILSYNLKIRNIEQPYINSADIAIKGDIIEFDGLNSYLPGAKILTYTWDFGDGSRSSGVNVKHSYKKKGEYSVNLGLTLKSASTGIVNKKGISKKIIVLDNHQEVASFPVKKASGKVKYLDPNDDENVKKTDSYSAENDFNLDAVFVVELATSKSRIPLNNILFRKVPKKFSITEKHISDTASYSYTIDQQMSLMATYPSYREVTALGFKDARIKIYLLKDKSEKELHNLIKINGAFADSYFDTSERLTSNAYIMLDQIFKLMNKYPPMKLELDVHTDNTGPAENKLALSQRHSQYLVNYLIKRGIDTKRIIAMGFGGSKPIAPNFLEKDRKLNRRIDFIIIN
jgi:outer membrane protein OmpA-like peptidoglycan-associated protein